MSLTMHRVALATARHLPEGDPDDAPLVSALLERGVDAEWVVWDDPLVPWDEFDGCLIRTTWDYHQRLDEYLKWLTHVGLATRLWNPARVARWNAHKSYLRELADAGVPTVPTVWLPKGKKTKLRDLVAERGWSRIVVKPTVSAGARETSVLDAGEIPFAERVVDQLAKQKELMVQPFLESVVVGELSVVVLDGQVTHAVRKVPARGDFRVQLQHGGRFARATPAEAHLDVTRRALAVPDDDLLYARVDMIAGDDGAPLLVELEVLEPSLYLMYDGAAAGVLADGIVARLARR